MAAARHLGPDIDARGVRLDGDGDPLFFHEGAGPPDIGRGSALDNHEGPVGVPGEGAEGRRNGHAAAARPGHAHRDGVPEDVAVKRERDVLGRRPERAGGGGRGQRHAHRLGAAEGRDHVAFEDREDRAVSFRHNFTRPPARVFQADEITPE